MSIFTSLSKIQKDIDTQQFAVIDKANQIRELYNRIVSNDCSTIRESELHETMQDLNADLLFERCQLMKLQLILINERFIREIHPEQLN